MPRVPQPDYTSRDRESIVADAKAAIPAYCPDWTDHNDSDPGITLLNLFGGMMDVLHLYVDRAAGEMFLPSAVKRESVVALLKLVGFELRSLVPAGVDVVFSLDAPRSSPLLIPEGTKIQTVASEDQTPVVFETTADLTIAALALSGTVSALEGESGTEDLDDATGLPFQEFPVEATIIVEDSLEFEVDEGSGYVTWELVTSFVDSGPTDLHYRIERNADDEVSVFVGDGLQGKIPNATARTRAQFRKIEGDRGGPGVFGNVGANTIRIVQDTIFDSGLRVTVSVNNPAQAAGGEDRQSIEEAKRLGPASVRALNRAVTVEDYKTLTEQFGGVAKAKVTQGSGSDPCCACTLEVYVAPTGGGVLAQIQKDALLAYLDERKMVGTCLSIEDPTYVDIDMAGTVFVFSNFDLPTVQAAIDAAIEEFFDIMGEFADFGEDVFLGNLFAALEAVPGVQHIDLSTVTRRPAPVLEIWSGNASFSAIEVGAPAVNETWIITFLNPTTFSVIGSESGIQANGTLGTPYVSDGEEISFTLLAGSSPPVLGDRATFVTSTKFGNVPLDATEIMQKGTTDLTYAVIPARSTTGIC